MGHLSREQLRSNVVRGTASGYLRLAVRLGLGLVIFRLLYQGLSPEAFGFWALLWALFGYGVVLDFGFGYAIQKRVAELSLHQDWSRLGEVLSTVLACYAAIALVAAVAGVAAAGPLITLFKVSAANRDSFRLVLQVFLVGTCLAFPLAVFPEILLGQQRIVLANYLGTAALLTNFVAIVASLAWGFSFLTLVVLALFSSLVPNLAAAWLALRALPKVRLRLASVSRATLVDTARFSLYAYVNTLGTVLRNKADQPIIGGVLGVAAVAPFQPGSKLGEMFGLVTRQIADVLSPAAAHLHARGDDAGLRDLLLTGLRFSVLVATPLYVVLAAYLDGWLRWLTGLAQPTPAMFWSGQLLLLWYYLLAITHWVFKRMFLMAGQERRIMALGLAEAVLNLALSLAATLALRSIVGVALGSLIPTILLGWGILWGWAAKETRLTRLGLLRQTVGPAGIACAPMIAGAALLRVQPLWPSAATPALFLTEITLVALLGLAGIWQLGLTPAERNRCLAWARRIPSPPE